jgi:hypothetical protein
VSDPWLAHTVLSPSILRRRFLAGAAAVCLLVALALAVAAFERPGVTVWLAALAAAGGAVSTWRAACGCRHAPLPALQVDADGRIAAGWPATAPARATFVSPLLVVLDTRAGAVVAVWRDALPRVGFRRLVVAARRAGSNPAA